MKHVFKTTAGTHFVAENKGLKIEMTENAPTQIITLQSNCTDKDNTHTLIHYQSCQ